MDVLHQLSTIAAALAVALRSHDSARLPALVDTALSTVSNGSPDVDERIELLHVVAVDAVSNRWSGTHLRLLDHLAATAR